MLCLFSRLLCFSSIFLLCACDTNGFNLSKIHLRRKESLKTGKHLRFYEGWMPSGWGFGMGWDGMIPSPVCNLWLIMSEISCASYVIPSFASSHSPFFDVFVNEGLLGSRQTRMAERVEPRLNGWTASAPLS
ncbi:hypothetical protein I7I51_01939 [Histoplasma capsulatum]|uniref:Secreted protein n=1 Tax=Ajellomyces capsulatus TaxID=5037 RepID=A0A8A1MG42_AJECA|nr:hypothetical protein I7I51_01939 [Histoplasma capsulatum]